MFFDGLAILVEAGKCVLISIDVWKKIITKLFKVNHERIARPLTPLTVLRSPARHTFGDKCKITCLIFFNIQDCPERYPGLSFQQEAQARIIVGFVLDAIGLPESLSPDNHEPRTVSFLMIDLRIRLLQQREPDRALKCGAPAVGDAIREGKLKEVIHELVSTGKLQRCRQADRWEILSGDAERQRLRA